MTGERRAALVLDQTSAECVRYTLVCDGAIIWRGRAFAALPASHAGVRSRMARWAVAHGVVIVEAGTIEAEPAKPRQVINAQRAPGRYGRH